MAIVLGVILPETGMVRIRIFAGQSQAPIQVQSTHDIPVPTPLSPLALATIDSTVITLICRILIRLQHQNQRFPATPGFRAGSFMRRWLRRPVASAAKRCRWGVLSVIVEFHILYDHPKRA